MATWPASLPQTLLYDLTEKRQAGKVRSQMDTGPAKQRKRFTATVKEYVGALILTQAQLATFKTFYETTLGEGVDSFTWVDPFTEVSASLRFGDGEPEVQMVRPSDTLADRLYHVSIPSLEKLP